MSSGASVGVRGGGHSVAGHSSPDGALLIDMSRWRGATVDPAARTADALAGYPPDSWARLQQLKRRLDPANRFRFNANIPPAKA